MSACHILNRHQIGTRREAERSFFRSEMASGPCLALNGTTRTPGYLSRCVSLFYLFFVLRCSQTMGEYENEVDPEGGMRRRGQGTRTAPRARWVSIMLNRKWSPAIECLSAAAPGGTQWRWYKTPKV